MDWPFWPKILRTLGSGSSSLPIQKPAPVGPPLRPLKDSINSNELFAGLSNITATPLGSVEVPSDFNP
jgi:hypothetical protein